MYIYHGVPENIVGTELVPLNLMSGELASTRAQQLQKYEGREAIMERQVPLLNCLWNDVVQFLPLHPQHVFSLQQEMGIIQEVPPYRFYEIPLELLNPSKTVVFFKTAPGEENTRAEWLQDVDVASLQTIPNATKAYYQSVVGTGELPFNYQFIPHIVYAGTVDVSTVNVITLQPND